MKGNMGRKKGGCGINVLNLSGFDYFVCSILIILFKVVIEANMQRTRDFVVSKTGGVLP